MRDTDCEKIYSLVIYVSRILFISHDSTSHASCCRHFASVICMSVIVVFVASISQFYHIWNWTTKLCGNDVCEVAYKTNHHVVLVPHVRGNRGYRLFLPPSCCCFLLWVIEIFVCNKFLILIQFSKEPYWPCITWTSRSGAGGDAKGNVFYNAGVEWWGSFSARFRIVSARYFRDNPDSPIQAYTTNYIKLLVDILIYPVNKDFALLVIS